MTEQQRLPLTSIGPRGTERESEESDWEERGREGRGGGGEGGGGDGGEPPPT